jgi:transcriptional regulator with XRE-family HTH domain
MSNLSRAEGIAAAYEVDKDAEFDRKISQRLRLIRKTLGLSEQEAADATRVTIKTYRKWEAGAPTKRFGPIECLCREFEVSIEWMISGEGQFLQESNEALWARYREEWKGKLNDGGRPFVAGAVDKH